MPVGGGFFAEFVPPRFRFVSFAHYLFCERIWINPHSPGPIHAFTRKLMYRLGAAYRGRTFTTSWIEASSHARPYVWDLSSRVGRQSM